VSHTALVIDSGTFSTANIVEALSKVEKHTIVSQYEKETGIEITCYRPLDLDDTEREIIVKKAISYVGCTYGYAKILTNFLDFLLGGLYVFRRITTPEKDPMCYEIVSIAYSEDNLYFGTEPGAALPEEILLYCEAHPKKYQKIFTYKK